MSNRETRALAQLAQFFESRLAPAFGALVRVQQEDNAQLAWTIPFFENNLYESLGWMVEGVFCGYFPRSDAELLWTRFRRPLSEHFSRDPSPNPSASNSPVAEQLRRLLTCNEAFPVAE